MNKPSLIVVGGGGQANVIIDALNKQDYSQVYIEDPFISEKCRYGVDIVKNFEILGKLSFEFIIAIGSNFLRSEITKSISTRVKDPKFATVIHPTAYVSPRARIGEGTVICGGAFVGPETITGRGVILNTNCSVDHNCILSDFCSIGPAATLGGNVNIGRRSVIAISATIKHRINVGNDVVVGARSLLMNDISADAELWYGTPSRKIRNREIDENYL